MPQMWSDFQKRGHIPCVCNKNWTAAARLLLSQTHSAHFSSADVFKSRLLSRHHSATLGFWEWIFSFDCLNILFLLSLIQPVTWLTLAFVHWASDYDCRGVRLIGHISVLLNPTWLLSWPRVTLPQVNQRHQPTVAQRPQSEHWGGSCNDFHHSWKIEQKNSDYLTQWHFLRGGGWREWVGEW